MDVFERMTVQTEDRDLLSGRLSFFSLLVASVRSGLN